MKQWHTFSIKAKMKYILNHFSINNIYQTNMAPKYFFSAFIFILLLNFSLSQPAQNILRPDASMIEEMSKMVLTQFSSILSPKTLAKFSSPKTSTPASSVTTSSTTSTEKIRQCTCSESDDCISEAYRSYSKCQNSCKSHLEYYSSKPEEFILCIPKNPSGFSTINNCLKENIQDFCSDSDGSRITFIQKPNYNQSLTFEFNFDFGKAVIDMVVLEHLKAFYSCAGSCMKEKIVGCYNRKLCGINLPKNHDLGNIGYFCPAFQSSVNSNLIKALPCFAMQQIFPKFFN